MVEYCREGLYPCRQNVLPAPKAAALMPLHFNCYRYAILSWGYQQTMQTDMNKENDPQVAAAWKGWVFFTQAATGTVVLVAVFLLLLLAFVYK